MIKKIIFLIVLLSAVLVFFKLSQKNQMEMSHKVETYTNSLYGFSFTYPDTYKLTTKEEYGHFIVILVDKNESEQPQSEGPTSISIHVYNNILLEDWLKKNESNFGLATDSGSTILFQGMQALQYSWDGLYQGKTIAFSRGGNVFVLTGTYLEKGDSRYVGFENLINSFILKDQVIQEELILRYLQKNISILSPEKEVLGGTYYVTKFTDTGNNSGTVEYEDGHNAYRAKVSYSFDETGNIQINSFKIIK